MVTEIGESIVGSYLRHVRECDLVLYNEFTGENQGEVDVVGIKAQGATGPEVWLCEVTTHIAGLLYHQDKAKERAKIRQKIDNAFAFAGRVFEGHAHHFELWSPVVSVGQKTDWLESERARRQSLSQDVTFIYNDDYTSRLQELVDCARLTSATTGEPAFRMLQVLTRLRGDDLHVGRRPALTNRSRVSSPGPSRRAR